MELYLLVHKKANSRTDKEGGGREIFLCPEMHKIPGINVVIICSKHSFVLIAQKQFHG